MTRGSLCGMLCTWQIHYVTYVRELVYTLCHACESHGRIHVVAWSVFAHTHDMPQASQLCDCVCEHVFIHTCFRTPCKHDVRSKHAWRQISNYAPAPAATSSTSAPSSFPAVSSSDCFAFSHASLYSWFCSSSSSTRITPNERRLPSLYT